MSTHSYSYHISAKAPHYAQHHIVYKTRTTPFGQFISCTSNPTSTRPQHDPNPNPNPLRCSRSARMVAKPRCVLRWRFPTNKRATEGPASSNHTEVCCTIYVLHTLINIYHARRTRPNPTPTRPPNPSPNLASIHQAAVVLHEFVDKVVC